jgi:hypothetical protein
MTPVLIIFLMLLFVGSATYAVAEWLASRLIRARAEHRQTFGEASDGYE